MNISFNNIKFVLVLLALGALLIFIQGCQITIGNHTYPSDRLAPGVISKTYAVDFTSSEIKHLQLIDITGISANDAEGTISEDDHVRLSVSILSDTERGINTFFKNMEAQDNGATLQLQLFRNMPNFCHYSEFGGMISVKGVCAKNLKFELPKNSPIRVMLRNIRNTKYIFSIKDNAVIKELYSGETVSELMEILNQLSFGSDKLSILETFVHNHPGRIFKAKEAADILYAMAFDNVKTAQLLSGRVRDRENLKEAFSHQLYFSGDEEMVLDYLSQ